MSGMADGRVNGNEATRFGAVRGLDPAEAGRRSAEARRRRRDLDPMDALLARILESGTTQGLASLWRRLDAKRDAEQVTVEEVAERKAALEEEIATLGAEVVGLQDVRAYVDRETERVSAEADAIEERASETRRQLESQEVLSPSCVKLARTESRPGWSRSAGSSSRSPAMRLRRKPAGGRGEERQIGPPGADPDYGCAARISPPVQAPAAALPAPFVDGPTLDLVAMRLERERRHAARG
jgi:hypothetical protein